MRVDGAHPEDAVRRQGSATMRLRDGVMRQVQVQENGVLANLVRNIGDSETQ